VATKLTDRKASAMSQPSASDCARSCPDPARGGLPSEGLRLPGRHSPGDAGGRECLPSRARLEPDVGAPEWGKLRRAPSDRLRFRDYVRKALVEGPLTRSELAATLGRSRRYRHLRSVVADGNDTLLKPLSWQGDMGLGPVRDGEATFLDPEQRPRWAGTPDLDEVGPVVVARTSRPTARRLRTGCTTGSGRDSGQSGRDVTHWLTHLDERLETTLHRG
jgi:hypothetical protein